MNNQEQGEDRYRVTHYDGTVTTHPTLAAAFKESAKRLEPWREGRDTVQRQDWEPSAETGTYVFVVTPHLEPTDAESYVELIPS